MRKGAFNAHHNTHYKSGGFKQFRQKVNSWFTWTLVNNTITKYHWCRHLNVNKFKRKSYVSCLTFRCIMEGDAEHIPPPQCFSFDQSELRRIYVFW